MKKILALLGLVVCTSASTVLLAQEKNSFEIGLQSGVNVSTVILYDDEENNRREVSNVRTGLNVTLSGDYYFSQKLSLKAKVIYDQKGWHNGIISDINGNNFETNYHVDYITIPVGVSAHFGRKFNWYLNVGPYVGFLLSAKATAFNFDVKSALKNTDLGLDFAVGLKIPIANQLKLNFEFGGQGGLLNVAKSSNGDVLRNSRFNLNGGLIFSL